MCRSWNAWVAAVLGFGCGDSGAQDGESSDGSATTGTAESASDTDTDTDTSPTSPTSDTGNTAGSCEPLVDCEPILSGFTACGGDVVGDWNVTAQCTVFAGPFPSEACPEDVLETQNAGANGTATFDATTVAYTDLARVPAGHATTPLSCLDDGATCDDAAQRQQSEWDEACCALVGDVCDCWMWDLVPPEGPQTFQLDYMIDGTTLSTSDGNSWEFCVAGDVLAMQAFAGMENETVMVMERK